MSNEIEVQNTSMVATQVEIPMGFEEENESDMIIPRVKVVNLLSPEFKEKVAEEGDVINSLTKEKLNNKTFIPVFNFYSNILWKDRSEGGGIACHSKDGKIGIGPGGEEIKCIQCRKNEFDNNKTGKDSYPTCTKYINFFGFVAGEKLPLILNFAKTNYNEGKKLYSLAKVTMQNMWYNGYTLSSKAMAKGGNNWYNIEIKANGKTDDEDREYGKHLFMNFRKADLNVDVADQQTESAPSVDTTNTEF